MSPAVAFDPGRRRVRRLYERMLGAYGAQHWWPADSRLEIIVGAVLTQNTAWTNVEFALERLKSAQALTLERLLELPHEVLAECLRPAGYFNVKARRLQHLLRVIADAGGEQALVSLPTSPLRELLLAAHGTGPETADDILLYAYGRPVFVIDAYTRRLFARLGWADGGENYEVLRAGMERACTEDVALMQELHALIVRHAKVVCRHQPLCDACVLSAECLHFRRYPPATPHARG